MGNETEQIDKLFLELSQFTRATTAKELKLERENAELLKQVNRLDELKELARQSIVRIKAEALMEARSVVQTSLEHITDAWGEADPVEAVGATHDYLLAQLDDLIEREGKEADNE